ncbi:MAG: hypothetical protein ABR505_00900, partial [Actinomycetota bacterium]
DLNRSILSFRDSVDFPKVGVIAGALQGPFVQLEHVEESFSGGADHISRWIVCGADDPSVRPICQALWPERLVVAATEDHFGQVATHTPHDTHFCAGCFTMVESIGDEPAATIGPTSVMTGIVAAATLAKLALGRPVAARTDILTMRLDSYLALSEVSPAPNPACAVCDGRRNAS